MKKELKFLCPNGHLGFAPTKEGSFYIGPGPPGSDNCTSLKSTQIHDLELMFVEARKLGVPMIIGSSGDTGSNKQVDSYVQIIKDSTSLMYSSMLSKVSSPQIHT